MRYKYIDENTRVKKGYLGNRYYLQRSRNFMSFKIWKEKAYTHRSIHTDLDDMVNYLLRSEKRSDKRKESLEPLF